MKITSKQPLPAGWQWITIGGPTGASKIVNGSTPSSAEPRYWGGNIQWATPADVGKLDDIYLFQTERTITEEGYKSCSTQLLPVGTVLLTSRAPVGNIAIAAREMCTNQGFKSLIPRDGVDSLYLYFAIKAIIPQIQEKAHGNTFDEITKPALCQLEIAFPPTIEEQRSIAKKLKQSIDIARAMRTAAERQLEAVSALPAATLREFFNFGSDSHA